MPFLNKLIQRVRPSRLPEAAPAEAYDVWSKSYDSQPDNLMLALDGELCGQLLDRVPLRGKLVADVGCGTGRHWQRLYEQRPARLVGFDVSTGMLARLQVKYPLAETHLLTSERLSPMADGGCDLVLSTLTIAHIANLRAALREWARVLRPGGDIIVTDYHPAALARGGQRTFRESDRVIAVRNHVYPIEKIRRLCRQLGLREQSLVERKIDDTMRPYYEKQAALALFERFRGVPIIYGLHLKKPDASE
ncbi:MAG TPA: class I SAM-dependent methyltransferase [Puia sp.]|nr:class I SAM-dependent methyltransferase [Puia sp.]